jgi:hypothetical protein
MCVFIAGGVTYRVVGVSSGAEELPYHQQTTQGVQVLGQAMNGQYYVINQDVLGMLVKGFI